MASISCSPPEACRLVEGLAETLGYGLCGGVLRGDTVGLVVGEACDCSVVRGALRRGVPVLAVGRGVVCLASCLPWRARLASLPEYADEVSGAGGIPVYAEVYVEDPVVSCIEASGRCLAEFIRMLRSHRLVGRVMWFTRGYPCRDGR